MLLSKLPVSSSLKRFASSSSSTITLKPPVPKAHHHAVLPSSSFPQGYALTGVHAGVKKNAQALDVAVILSTSTRPTSAAAVFTKNAFKAAPVVVSQNVLNKNGGRARAVVVNSGCANAVTGKQGLDDAWAMVNETDVLLSNNNSKSDPETLVMSTGVIGQTLPISKIIAGIQTATNSLGSDFSAWERAAKAFMTTDTFPKLRSRIFTINGQEYRMAGMDKGAGMIHPDMGPSSSTIQPPKELHATLLGCILTDAAVSPSSLQSALNYAVQRSFNSISVDGEMSTNDTLLVMANGAATDDASLEIDEEATPDAYATFKLELTEFAVELAKLVVRDGEGATKFVTVTVEGAPTYEDAHRVASRVSTSALVKTALYGEDANWGRILSATGSISLPSETVIDPSRVSVSFAPSSPDSQNPAPLDVLVNGEPQNADEVRAKEILSQEDFEVRINMGLGKEHATYWTCDFSYEYVRINGDYRS